MGGLHRAYRGAYRFQIPGHAYQRISAHSLTHMSIFCFFTFLLTHIPAHITSWGCHLAALGGNIEGRPQWNGFILSECSRPSAVECQVWGLLEVEIEGRAQWNGSGGDGSEGLGGGYCVICCHFRRKALLPLPADLGRAQRYQLAVGTGTHSHGKGKA